MCKTADPNSPSDPPDDPNASNAQLEQTKDELARFKEQKIIDALKEVQTKIGEVEKGQKKLEIDFAKKEGGQTAATWWALAVGAMIALFLGYNSIWAIPKAVTDEVDKKVPIEVSNKVPAAVDKQVQDEVGKRVSGAVKSEVSNQIPAAVKTEVASQITQQVHSVVEIEVAKQVPEEVKQSTVGKVKEEAEVAAGRARDASKQAQGRTEKPCGRLTLGFLKIYRESRCQTCPMDFYLVVHETTSRTDKFGGMVLLPCQHLSLISDIGLALRDSGFP
jgi:hypothetical protein